MWGRGHRFGAKVGAGPGPAQSAQKIVVVPLDFLALKLQLVVLVSAFVIVNTVWSVSGLLFYSRCPPNARPFVKVGVPVRAPVLCGVGATGVKLLL